MEGTGKVQLLKDDKGLDFIIPLLMFMHRTCLRAVIRYIIQHFCDAQYIKNNFNTSEKHKVTLTEFLTVVDHAGKLMRKTEQEGRKKDKKQQKSQPPASVNPSGSNQPQHQHPTKSSQLQQHHQQTHTQYTQKMQCSWQQHKRSPQHSHRCQCNSGNNVNQRASQQQHGQSYQHHVVTQQHKYCPNINQQRQQCQSPHCSQQSSPQQDSRGQQICRGQSMGQNQQGAEGLPSAQTTKRLDLEERRPFDVQNIKENKDILKLVTVGNLMQKDDTCQVLMKLDINFVLNFVLNKVVKFPLDQDLLQALVHIKEVRKGLVHYNYHFTEEDFEKNLTKLNNAVEMLYRHGHNLQELRESVEACRQDAAMGNKAVIILGKLAEEAHKKYSPPDSTFVPPNVSFLQTSGEEVIKDLSKFVEDQNDHQDPTVLSGNHREEKTKLLEHLAFTFKEHKKFRLVVHVKERDKFCHQSWTVTRSNTDHPAVTLQDQVFACLKHLAPATEYQYGLDSLKATIKSCQKDVLFLVDWNINKLGEVRNELQKGTWVLTYEGKVAPQVEWKVLRVELYTQTQVLHMIKLHPRREVRDCYDRFDNKPMLSSLDMIQIFIRVCERFSVGSDFELVERYIQKVLEECDCNGYITEHSKQDIERLRAAAFFSLYRNELICSDINIMQCVCESFLCPIEGKGWSFKHSNVRDLLAAEYVVANSSEACVKWLENVVAFKRVFRFACFLWSSRHSSERKYLPYMKPFLETFLNIPKDNKIVCISKEAQSDEDMSNHTQNMEVKDSINKHNNVFNSWDFLLEVEEACGGKEKVTRLMMSILSVIPCWCFNAAQCVNLDKKMTRLEKVLRLATLNKDNPLSIELNGSTNMKIITEFWNKLRRMKAMYDCVSITVTVEEDDGSRQTSNDDIKEFFQTVVHTDVPLHITKYEGPLLTSCAFKFLRCKCIQKLESLKVNIKFDSEAVDGRQQEEEMDMVVESDENNGDQLLQSRWLSCFLDHLTMLNKLKRLHLRNINFFNHSNQTLIQKYNWILDTREEERKGENYGGWREFKRAEPPDMRKSAKKRARLSTD